MPFFSPGSHSHWGWPVPPLGGLLEYSFSGSDCKRGVALTVVSGESALFFQKRGVFSSSWGWGVFLVYFRGNLI